jgi:hypothetical protein
MTLIFNHFGQRNKFTFGTIPSSYFIVVGNGVANTHFLIAFCFGTVHIVPAVQLAQRCTTFGILWF